jgi:hypothetical protein
MKTRHLLILMTAAVAVLMVTLATATTSYVGQQQETAQSQATFNTGQTSMVIAETEAAYAQEDGVAAVNLEANQKGDNTNRMAQLICPMTITNGSIRGA